MTRPNKISFVTKFISNKYFLNEVRVDGKKSRKLHYRLGNYDQYAAQIITIGNCITLLSSPIAITDADFWNTNHFEDLAKYVFWTFNESFLLKLIEQAQDQHLPVLNRIKELLSRNPVAYVEPVPDVASDELRFCYRKNGNLKRSPKFQNMHALDEQNRKRFMEAVEKKMEVLSSLLPSPEPVAVADPPKRAPREKQSPPESTPFPQIVRSMNNGTPEETIEFFKEQIKLAGFKHALFSKLDRPNHKNHYHLNGEMAAMVRFFYDRNYFEKKYEFVEVFASYLKFTGNTVGKSNFLENYQYSKSFRKHYDLLKDLSISKLAQ